MAHALRLWLQNIADQKKRAEEMVSAAALETQRPTRASGVAIPAAVAEASRAGDKRRNRWDQGVSSECATLLPLRTINWCKKLF